MLEAALFSRKLASHFRFGSKSGSETGSGTGMHSGSCSVEAKSWGSCGSGSGSKTQHYGILLCAGVYIIDHWSGSGWRQCLAQFSFFNIKKFDQNHAFSIFEAALFPRNLASHFGFCIPFYIDPDPNPVPKPGPEPECISVPVPLRQKVEVPAVPVPGPQHSITVFCYMQCCTVPVPHIIDHWSGSGCRQ